MAQKPLTTLAPMPAILNDVLEGEVYSDLKSLEGAKGRAVQFSIQSNDRASAFAKRMSDAYAREFQPAIDALSKMPEGAAKTMALRDEGNRFKAYRVNAAKADSNLWKEMRELMAVRDIAARSKPLYSDTKRMLDESTLLDGKRAELFTQLKGSSSAQLQQYARRAVAMKASDPQGAKALAATVAALVERLPREHQFDTQSLADHFCGEESKAALGAIQEIDISFTRSLNRLREAEGQTISPLEKVSQSMALGGDKGLFNTGNVNLPDPTPSPTNKIAAGLRGE